MNPFDEIFNEFETPPIDGSGNPLPGFVKSHLKLLRVAIFFTEEIEPIKESYSFLLLIPSREVDNGVINFKNVIRGVNRSVFIKGKKELKIEYLGALKLWTNSTSCNLAYEGAINSEGVAATEFMRIGMKVGD